MPNILLCEIVHQFWMSVSPQTFFFEHHKATPRPNQKSKPPKILITEAGRLPRRDIIDICPGILSFWSPILLQLQSYKEMGCQYAWDQNGEPSTQGLLTCDQLQQADHHQGSRGLACLGFKTILHVKLRPNTLPQATRILASRHQKDFQV